MVTGRILGQKRNGNEGKGYWDVGNRVEGEGQWGMEKYRIGVDAERYWNRERSMVRGKHTETEKNRKLGRRRKNLGHRQLRDGVEDKYRLRTEEKNAGQEEVGGGGMRRKGRGEEREGYFGREKSGEGGPCVLLDVER